MTSQNSEIQEAFAKIPGLKNLVIPVEKIPGDAEFQAMTSSMEAELDAEIDAFIEGDLNLDFDFETAATTQPVTPGTSDVPNAPSATASLASASDGVTSKPAAARTQRISIRVPTAALVAYKARARKQGTPYQTLINRTLRAVMREWQSSRPPISKGSI